MSTVSMNGRSNTTPAGQQVLTATAKGYVLYSFEHQIIFSLNGFYSLLTIKYITNV